MTRFQTRDCRLGCSHSFGDLSLTETSCGTSFEEFIKINKLLLKTFIFSPYRGMIERTGFEFFMR